MLTKFISTMTLKVEIGDDKNENIQRYRQAYKNAERLMFGEVGSDRDYMVVVDMQMELPELQECGR